MDAEKLKELEANLALAKTKTLNFAFAAGTGKKEDACLLHKPGMQASCTWTSSAR